MARRKNPSQHIAVSSEWGLKRWALTFLVVAAAAVLVFILLVRGPRLSHPPDRARELTILIDNGLGGTFTVDGSNNPASILEAKVKELGVPVQSIWADGQELEFTFIYSARGCPVKTMVKRAADRTQRTSDLPVMFPDDPAAMVTISRLMRWQG
jgi:hypothetical protein